MRELREREKIGFLYVTHDLASARYVADEIQVMYRGHIVEYGHSDDVIQQPQHAYTRLLLSAVPDPEAGLDAVAWEGRTGETARARRTPVGPGRSRDARRGAPWPLRQARGDRGDEPPAWG